MDVNGLRFWMLADARDWDVRGAAHAEYDTAARRLRLASERPATAHAPFADEGARDAAEARAKSLVEVTPQARDAFGARAFFDAASNTVLADGAAPGAVPLFRLPDASHPSSLVLGCDGVIYTAVAPSGAIRLQDARDRWPPATLKASYTEGGEAKEFRAWRLAADPEGGVWALDRAARKLARVEGLPKPTRPYGPYAPSTFRPCGENRDEPRVRVFVGEVCPASETPVALACSPGGRVAVLSWVRRLAAHAPGSAVLRLVNRRGETGPAVTLLEAHYPYSMAWVSDERVALLSDEARSEALVYQLHPPAEAGDGHQAELKDELLPVGDVYPLKRGAARGPFLNGGGTPPRYPSGRGAKALHRLSLRTYARAGAAANRPAGGDSAANHTALDSGSAQTVWHRLYMEALIPPGCGVKVFLAATDTPVRPADGDADEWHEHRFGDCPEVGATVAPRAAWSPAASEIPFHPGLLGCEPKENRAGLFTALVQRTRRRVRTLRGRFVHARVELSGDGHATPEVAALRIYASRFSYLNNYLPELYREDLFGPDADEVVSAAEPCTRADFLERFIDNFEGVLTPLEDRIAHAHLLTDPRTAPEGALEWLGSWLGVAFDPAYPPGRRRRLLSETPDLYRERGTLRGLRRALDIVTDGAVEGGEIVVLEDFRLRRTFATILGADLADEEDPLLAGMAASGNSYVGDTLFLGDENKKEFLALFSADLELTAGERDAVEDFFERLAHRVTILVHQEIEPQDLGLVARVAEQEIPAHVIRRVVKASHPFLVGAASLVGVDTYLGLRPPRRPVGVGRTHIGEGDYVTRPPSLDPRLGGGIPEGVAALMRPVAHLPPLLEVREGASFVLDGGRSRAGAGRRLKRFVWEMEE